MDYSNYYEQPDFYGSPQPPKKRGGVVVAVIVTGIVCMLIGALIASFLLPKFANWPAPTPGEEVTLPEETTPPEVQETPVPTPAVTPAPTTRPIPEFDGQSPSLPGGYVNPIPDIVEACAPSVVGVSVYARDKVYDHMQMFGGGSGFVITSDGYIVTNAHVVEDAEMVEVTFSDGTAMEAELIGADYTTDIAVIKVDGKDLAALKLGDSSTLRVGEFAIAIGDPTGQELAGTTTFGIISALEREVNLDGQTNEYIQTDAAINPGNSGGPLLDTAGRMIGINTMIYSTSGSSAGIGFAVPVNTARRVVSDLIQYGSVRRGVIQASFVQLTSSIASYAKLGISRGLLVSELQRGGNGEKAGMRAGTEAVQYGSRRNGRIIYLGGDIITAMDGISVGSLADYYSILESKRPGDTVRVTVYRDGKYQELQVTLARE